MVDVRETRTSKNADKFVRITPGSDYEVISALRMLVAGKGDILPEEVGGVPKADLAESCGHAKSSQVRSSLLRSRHHSQPRPVQEH